MDYEKLHKDTIAKLQEMVNSGKITVETACGICADFVPKSEDERMVKFIKNQLFNIKKTITENYELDTKLTKAIDWLEKQGEHANFRNKIQVGDKVTRNEDGVLVNLSQLNRVAKKDEKQGKNNMGISEATKKKLEDKLNKALEKETPESWNKFLDEQGEQKPVEWSIFDYRTWQHIVSDVLTKRDGIGQYLDDGECKKIAKYMQEEWSKRLSVEQRSTELPKGQDYGIDGLYAAIDILTKTLGEVDGYQSDDGILEHKCAISAVKELSKQQKPWSEEDKKMSRFIGNAITTNGASIYLKSKGIQVIDAHVWLNGLKERVQPQNTWRPSDEQIGALESAISLLQSTTLESLCNELKKLREK